MPRWTPICVAATSSSRASRHDRERILEVGRHFGHVKETNFGRYFEVYSRPTGNDLAYRSVALGPHTDNPYRSPVPGIQLLHCLVNETSGGLSTLADSLKVLERLRSEYPDGYELLKTTPVRFRFVDAGTELVTHRTMIRTDDAGEPTGVHYSPRLDALTAAVRRGHAGIPRGPPAPRRAAHGSDPRDPLRAAGGGTAAVRQQPGPARPDQLRPGRGAAPRPGLLPGCRRAPRAIREPAPAPQIDRGGRLKMETVSFRQMEEGTREDYLLLDRREEEFNAGLVDRLLAALGRLDRGLSGYRVTRLEHSLQTAARAEADGADEDLIVAALLHDLGDRAGAAGPIPGWPPRSSAPDVRAEVTWIVQHHGLFQAYYYAHHLGGDPHERDRYRDHPWYQSCVDFCERYDQAAFDPDYPTPPLSHFEPMLRRVFARRPFDPEVIGPEPGSGD
ncbi:MAG: TauD/TfdA family dioxygenase [Gammaproteobacteria bacterium]|nr:TauD/TfdA family dioxygenase [Gammaproteobacteria bacterium]